MVFLQPSLPSPPSIQGERKMLFAVNKWQEQVQTTVTWSFTQALLRAELTAPLWSQGGRSIYYLWLEKCRGDDRHSWPSQGLRILRNCNNSLQRWLKGDLFLKLFKEGARGAWVKQWCLPWQCVCLRDSACCSYSPTPTHTSQRGSWASSCYREAFSSLPKTRIFSSIVLLHRKTKNIELSKSWGWQGSFIKEKFKKEKKSKEAWKILKYIFFIPALWGRGCKEAGNMLPAGIKWQSNRDYLGSKSSGLTPLSAREIPVPCQVLVASLQGANEIQCRYSPWP